MLAQKRHVSELDPFRRFCVKSLQTSLECLWNHLVFVYGWGLSRDEADGGSLTEEETMFFGSF